MNFYLNRLNLDFYPSMSLFFSALHTDFAPALRCCVARASRVRYRLNETVSFSGSRRWPTTPSMPTSRRWIIRSMSAPIPASCTSPRLAP
ncbi:hypothetical protein BOSEA31B_13634 [Hyphomicrobiales bacterium]|nr:hypothetical protein BOSEA31B_13634 [Hyphomicrobiales bacterium]